MRLAHLALLPALSLPLACRTTDAVVHDPRALVGSYQPLAPMGGIVGLELSEDGTYEVLVLAFMGPDGCATVVGNGVSQGTWHLDGDALLLDVTHETEDLALTLAGAGARLVEGGLELDLGEGPVVFEALGPSPY